MDELNYTCSHGSVNEPRTGELVTNRGLSHEAYLDSRRCDNNMYVGGEYEDTLFLYGHCEL